MSSNARNFTRILRMLMAAIMVASVAVSVAVPAAALASSKAKAKTKAHKVSVGYAGPFNFDSIADGSTSLAFYDASERGNIFQQGGAAFYGSPVSQKIHLDTPLVSIATTPKVKGYVATTGAGRVFAYGGKLKTHGQLAGRKLPSPICLIALTRDGRGYWLVACDGRTVYAFGDAHVYGSLPAGHTVVALLVTQDSKGYWLVTRDGAIYKFGDAHSLGSLGGRKLTSKVVGAALGTANDGIYELTAKGNVYNTAKAKFYGSAVNTRNVGPFVAIAATPNGFGYRLLSQKGKVLAYGNAVPPKPKPNPNADPLHPGSMGYDVSWPECNDSRPAVGNAMVIIGVNDGHANSDNPCLAKEWGWALTSRIHWLYVNTDNFDGLTGKSAFDYGYESAKLSMQYAGRLGIQSSIWWLDVETTNAWNGGASGNFQVLRGFVVALQSAGRVVGVYSTSFQWGAIAGGNVLSGTFPMWIPGASELRDLPAQCNAPRFAHGSVWMSQSSPGSLDFDYACGGASAAAVDAFQLFGDTLAQTFSSPFATTPTAKEKTVPGSYPYYGASALASQIEQAGSARSH